MPQRLLRVCDLSKRFDGTCAVDGFSVTVPERQVTSIVGPNGAGKTTLFNIISGFLRPDAGAVFFRAEPLTNLATWEIAQLGLSRTFQNIRIFGGMTVLENMLLSTENKMAERFLHSLLSFRSGSPEQRRTAEKATAILELVGLTDKRHVPAGDLSYGQQKLLNLACAVGTDASLLLLDEPVAGVQQDMIRRIEDVVRDLAHDHGKTILLIEHDLEFVMRISDTVIVMDLGKKIFEGSVSDMAASGRVLEAYLN